MRPPSQSSLRAAAAVVREVCAMYPLLPVQDAAELVYFVAAIIDRELGREEK